MHPFIRYEIGDVGILDEKSTLKKPILKKLIGRTSDVALLPSGKKSPGLTFYYVCLIYVFVSAIEGAVFQKVSEILPLNNEAAKYLYLFYLILY